MATAGAGAVAAGVSVVAAGGFVAVVAHPPPIAHSASATRTVILIMGRIFS
jgi:hypothetical protein